MLRPTMGGVSGRARKHGICRAMIPLPVAVSLAVTCFFFGLFYGRMPVNNTTNAAMEAVPLDASLQQQPQPQESLRQQQHIQHHRKQQEHVEVTRKQPEVVEQQAVAQPPQQQQQQQGLVDQQHPQDQRLASTDQQVVAFPPQEPCPRDPAAPASQQEQLPAGGREPQHAQQQQQQQPEKQAVEQQQASKQEAAAAAPSLQTEQASKLKQPGQEAAKQDMQQQQRLQPGAQEQQRQPQQQEQLQQEEEAQSLHQSGPAGAPVMTDVEQRMQHCLHQSGLLQPLLTPAESGHDHYTTATYQILSWYPRIVVYPHFIDQARAQHIVGLATARVQRSEVKLRQGESYTGKGRRSSSGVFIRRDEDPEGALGWLEDKIEAVTLIPRSHGEAFYAIRYKQHEKYDSHMDVFDPAEYGPQKTLRMATLIVYLSEVEAGGETVFKREGKDGDQRKVADAAACGQEDFKYRPRFGDAVLFYSLNPDNSIDQRSLHGGCPVHEGTKWVITKWMHNKPVQTGGFGWA